MLQVPASLAIGSPHHIGGDKSLNRCAAEDVWTTLTFAPPAPIHCT
jgi:hypothetical protein